MFFEQAREQAQRAYERDGTDAAVSLCVCVNNEVSLRKPHCAHGKSTFLQQFACNHVCTLTAADARR